MISITFRIVFRRRKGEGEKGHKRILKHLLPCLGEVSIGTRWFIVSWVFKNYLYILYPGERHDNPLQYFCLENPMDRGAWRAAVHGVAQSRTRLNDWAYTYILYNYYFIFNQYLIKTILKHETWDFPGGPKWLRICQCRGHGFDSWSGKIPHVA